MPKIKKLTGEILRNKLLPLINAIVALCKQNYRTEPALVPLRKLAGNIEGLSVKYATPEQYLDHVINFVTALSSEKEEYQTLIAHFTRTIIFQKVASIRTSYTYNTEITGLLGTLIKPLNRDIEHGAYYTGSIRELGEELAPFLVEAKVALGVGSTDLGASVISREDDAESAVAATGTDNRIERQPVLPSTDASLNRSEEERVVSGLTEHAHLLPRPPSRAPEEPINEVCPCRCTIL